MSSGAPSGKQTRSDWNEYKDEPPEWWNQCDNYRTLNACAGSDYPPSTTAVVVETWLCCSSCSMEAWMYHQKHSCVEHSRSWQEAMTGSCKNQGQECSSEGTRSARVSSTTGTLCRARWCLLPQWTNSRPDWIATGRTSSSKPHPHKSQACPLHWARWERDLQAEWPYYLSLQRQGRQGKMVNILEIRPFLTLKGLSHSPKILARKG